MNSIDWLLYMIAGYIAYIKNIIYNYKVCARARAAIINQCNSN